MAGQHEFHFGASRCARAESDASAVSSRYGAADGEPETGSAVVALGLLSTEKSLEHLLLLVRSDAGASVPHLERHLFVVHADPDADGRAARGVAQHVFEQVHQHLLDEDGVDQNQRQVLGHIDFDRKPIEAARKARQNAEHQVVEGLWRASQLHSSAFEARDAQ